MPSLAQRAFNKAKREAVRRTAVFRNPAKAAVIGCGQIAASHVNGYELSGAARVVAVCDVLPETLAKALDRWPWVRAYRDYRQMLEELRPDVVSVCTWPQHHAAIVIEAAQSGVKGILCEKPLALRKEELEAMQAVCREHGVKLAGGHQFRFHPNYVRAAEWIRSGRVGEVETVIATISGAMANRGPHLIDSARFLLGDVAAESVICDCERQGRAFNRGLPEETSAQGEIAFERGGRLMFQTGAGQSDVLAIEVQGTSGCLTVSTQGVGAKGSFRKTPRLEFRTRQFREFIRWVKGRQRSYRADGEQSAASAELVLAAYESARAGRRIALPLTTKGDILSTLYADPQPPPEFPASALPTADAIATATGGGRLAIDGGPRAVPKWFRSDPAVGVPEIWALAKVVLSKKLGSTSGSVTRAFEEEFAALYGSPRAIASTSGTAALHVALGAIDPEPGDEVITTPMSDMGTVIPILCCNCVPVFADVDPVTGNLTAESIQQKITPRTRAVILVHLFGRPAEMDSICALLARRQIPLIEDCAQAHVAEYRGKKVGTFGDFGCFSLQSSKQITCGDGGVTLVNSDAYFRRAELYADKGFDRSATPATVRFLAPNYRMTELQAAVARCQLRRLSGLIEARRDSATRLREQLSRIPHVLLPAETHVRSAWWRFTFGLDEDQLGVETLDVVRVLNVEGIRTSKEFPPRPLFEHDIIALQRTYGNSGYPLCGFDSSPPTPDEYPGFRDFARRIVPIGWSATVTNRHVDRIAEGVRKAVQTLNHCADARMTAQTLG